LTLDLKIPDAFYPEDQEGTSLYKIQSDANRIALNRLEQIKEIKESG
jgi:FtsZ-binding cell division protein ZapB|tara:strand:+ start:942 stop:1082 length:141 start_codon:yes stop_codon:yes gene_type:complete